MDEAKVLEACKKCECREYPIPDSPIRDCPVLEELELEYKLFEPDKLPQGWKIYVIFEGEHKEVGWVMVHERGTKIYSESPKLGLTASFQYRLDNGVLRSDNGITPTEDSVNFAFAKAIDTLLEKEGK